MRPSGSGCATPSRFARAPARRSHAISGGEEGGGASAALAAAEAALGRVSALDPALDALAERAVAAAVELGDLAGELRGYVEGIEAEPGRLEQVEKRLDEIERLMRKHGGSVAAVLAHAEHCRAELERLERASERGAKLEAALGEAEAKRAKLGKRLSESRAAAAPKLEQQVGGGAGRPRDGWRPARGRARRESRRLGRGRRRDGRARVATNPGMPIAPLRDAASGGELSRVMLALSGTGQAGDVETLAFDEIDAGVGGNGAAPVGERLRALGEGRQVVCITHLPRSPRSPQTHFRVVKEAAGDATVARVERVDGDGWSPRSCGCSAPTASDEAAGRHARELLTAA